MPRVNLLPWRETLRADRQKRFFIALGITAAAAVVLVLLANLYVQYLISNQNSLNQILKDEIVVLDRQIKEINSLQAKKDALLARMNIIQSLQATRPQIVHLFDEIARRLPEGIFLQSLVQKGDALTLVGIAQSNARVSAFMRNIEQSEWIGDPELNVIRANQKDGSKVSNFTLKLKLKKPNAGTEQAQ